MKKVKFKKSISDGLLCTMYWMIKAKHFFLLHISLITIFQAPSKDAVSKTCHEAFLYSDRRNVPQTVLTQIASLYEIDQKTTREVGVG